MKEKNRAARRRREDSQSGICRRSHRHADEVRGLAVVLAALIAAAALIGALAVRAGDTRGRDDFVPVAVTVRAGDTAWSIADRFCPQGVDKREYLTWCAEANGLDGMGALRAGENYIFLEEVRA